MSVANFLARLKLSQNDAEVIFDRNEPIGRPTDLVLPRKERRSPGRRRSKHETPERSGERPSLS